MSRKTAVRVLVLLATALSVGCGSQRQSQGDSPPKAGDTPPKIAGPQGATIGKVGRGTETFNRVVDGFAMVDGKMTDSYAEQPRVVSPELGQLLTVSVELTIDAGAAGNWRLEKKSCHLLRQGVDISCVGIIDPTVARVASPTSRGFLPSSRLRGERPFARQTLSNTTALSSIYDEVGLDDAAVGDHLFFVLAFPADAYGPYEYSLLFK